jgi:hypothetical protein
MWQQQMNWLECYSHLSRRPTSTSPPLPVTWDLIDQLYVTSYMYHYEEDDILIGKPWDFGMIQVTFLIIILISQGNY